MSTLSCILAFFMLILGAVRAGHEMWTLNINALLAVLIAFVSLFNRRFSLKPKELYLFLLIAGLEVPVQWLIHDHFGIFSAATGVLTLTMMVGLTSLLLRKDHGKYYWSVLNLISMAASWCLIIQMLLYSVGIRLDKIPVLSELFFKAWENTIQFRPCGMFSEPSHMAEITLLSLYYYLFIKVDFRRAVIITTALILSTSNLGIVGSVMLIGLYIWNLDSSSWVRKFMKGLIVLGALFAAIEIFRWMLQSDSWVVERLLKGGTFTGRTMRSFELFGRMDLFEKLFGIGIQNQALYLNHHWITLASDTLQEVRVNREFAQTLGYILCTTGLLGIIPFLLPFIKNLVTGNYRIKCFVLLFLVICLTCCTFSRHVFVLHIILFFATEEMVGNGKSNSQRFS